MAEGFTRHHFGDYFDVYSAGTKPKGISIHAIKAMAELGIDITAQSSKSVEKFISEEFDLVVTLCDNAKESCPVFPGTTEIIHLRFEDPASAVGSDEEIVKIFRKVRDDIQERLLDYFKEKYSIVLDT